MQEIEALQGRIMAALERIGHGVEALSAPAAEPEPGLAEALAEERLANEQLRERLRALNAKHLQELESLRTQLGEIDRMRADMETQGEAVTRLDTDLQRLRQANAQLRASNAALREANEAGVGEPHLINKAMLAELEALRAGRAADISEAAALLARLEPLLDGTAEEETA